MKPFEFKWSCIGIPIKTVKSGGYDVVRKSNMNGGFLPSQINSERINDVEKITDDYCGYHLIKHYLKKTGKTIFETTITLTVDILKETEDFWN